MRKLWGGAFAGSASARADAFGRSLEGDLAFWREDVTGSIAHARMLGATGIVSPEESATLVAGLERILAEGVENLPTDVEDVHTAVEARLGEIVGPEVAGRLHTARSRNDQVATDARLALRRLLAGFREGVKGLQGVLLDTAETHAGTLMPGYTHQQRAQPITLGYWAAAHFWAFQRHGWRSERLDEVNAWCPLGSAALAGTGFPVDRAMTAAALGFAGPTPSALDATSDRSHLLDALHLATGAMTDLSRLAQEIVLWSGREFAFVRLSDAVTTGSSIMPQKRNPDMAELIRGRSARALAHYVHLAGVMKGLPLGYNRDTQEDKPPLFDSFALVDDSLALSAEMLSGATWDVARMAAATRGDFSTATDLADFLAARGLPFRAAHEVVGRVVRGSFDRGIALEDLDEGILAEIAPEVPPEALSVLSAEGSVARRDSLGGPSPSALAVQIARARELWSEPGFARIA